MSAVRVQVAAVGFVLICVFVGPAVVRGQDGSAGIRHGRTWEMGLMTGEFFYSGGARFGAMPVMSIGYAWLDCLVTSLEVGFPAHDGLDFSFWSALRTKWVFLRSAGGTGPYVGGGLSGVSLNGVSSSLIDDIEGVPNDFGGWNVGGLGAFLLLGVDWLLGESFFLAPEIVFGTTLAPFAQTNDFAYGCGGPQDATADGSVWHLLAGLKFGFY